MARIVFWHTGMEISGHSLEMQPLGGTESALIYMAKALVLCGHHISIYTNVNGAHQSDGVYFYPLRDAELHLNKLPADILICLRQTLPALALPAKFHIYFSPDAYDQPFVNRAFTVRIDQDPYAFEAGFYSLRFAKKWFDLIFCVGHWQAKTFMDRFHIPEERCVVCGNGVDVNLFDHNPELNNRQPSIIYASTPFRGLDHLIRLFPQIQDKVPNARCDVYSGMQLYGSSIQEDESEFGHIYAQARQYPSVHIHAPVCKLELAHAMQQARVMAYPNTFAETFCIAVLEAQAAGLPVITTGLAGLNERISHEKNGFLIPGRPGDVRYDEQFVQHVCHLMTNDSMWELQSQKAFEASRRWDYSVLANEWTDYFNTLNLSKRVPHKAELSVTAQSTSVLINGYPKKVEISERIMRHYLAGYLRGFELHQAACKIDS